MQKKENLYIKNKLVFYIILYSFLYLFLILKCEAEWFYETPGSFPTPLGVSFINSDIVRHMCSLNGALWWSTFICSIRNVFCSTVSELSQSKAVQSVSCVTEYLYTDKRHFYECSLEMHAGGLFVWCSGNMPYIL